jgi:hypothetical protein
LAAISDATEGSKYPSLSGVGVYGTPGATGYVPPSGSTSKTLILVGLILQAIGVLIGLAAGALTFLVAPIFGIFYLAFAALGIVWLILVWMLSYAPVQAGRYEAARTPTLIFAILSIITIFGIIAGILYLVAYIKLGDAVREQQMPPQGYPGAAPMMTPGMPYGGQPYGGQPMQQPMQPMQQQPMQPQPMQPMQQQPMQPMQPMAPAPAPGVVICPTCGKPATYVPQYNRYYCYTDQKYV